MTNQNFELLGHDNPLGRYPAPVVPIGYLGDRLVAVYASKKGADIINLEDDVLFVKYEESIKDELCDFRYLDHRLFAFSETKVESYSISSEADFFRDLFDNPTILHQDPFFRLSLAKGTANADMIVKEVVLCLKTLVAEESEENPFLNAWYETQRSELSRSASHSARISLPVNWRVLLKTQSKEARPRAAQTLTFRRSATYRDDLRSTGYQRDYERNFFRGGATTGAVAAKKRMTQSDVINYFAERTGMKRAQVKQLFEDIAKLATSEVKSNGEFVLPGFGKLVRSERKAREGRNPATGETIQIPAKTTLKFRVGKAMKDSVLPKK